MRIYIYKLSVDVSSILKTYSTVSVLEDVGYKKELADGQFDSQVYVDGVAIDEPYILGSTYAPGYMDGPITVEAKLQMRESVK